MAEIEIALRAFNEYKENEAMKYGFDFEFKPANSASSSNLASALENDLVKKDILHDRFIMFRWQEGWEACKVIANFRQGPDFN